LGGKKLREYSKFHNNVVLYDFLFNLKLLLKSKKYSNYLSITKETGFVCVVHVSTYQLGRDNNEKNTIILHIIK
jgi:hypothetical protein